MGEEVSGQVMGFLCSYSPPQLPVTEEDSQQQVLAAKMAENQTSLLPSSPVVQTMSIEPALLGKWKLFTRSVVMNQSRIDLTLNGAGIVSAINFKDHGVFDESGINVAGKETFSQGSWVVTPDGKIRIEKLYNSEGNTGVHAMELRGDRLIRSENVEGEVGMKIYSERRRM